MNKNFFLAILSALIAVLCFKVSIWSFELPRTWWSELLTFFTFLGCAGGIMSTFIFLITSLFDEEA